MKVIFKDNELKQLYLMWKSWKYPKWVIISYIEKVATINSIESTNDMKAIKSRHFEKLNNYKKWWYSIRINNKYRLIFNIANSWILEVVEITELSKHYQ